MRKDLVIKDLCEVPGTVTWHSEFHKGETSSPSDLFPPPVMMSINTDLPQAFKTEANTRTRMETLSSGLEVYGIVSTGAAHGTQEHGTSAALHRTLLHQSASGTVSLANVPLGPGRGGSKGDCWGGVYWANLIRITGNITYAFLTTSEIFTSALMP